MIPLDDLPSDRIFSAVALLEFLRFNERKGIPQLRTMHGSASWVPCVDLEMAGYINLHLDGWLDGRTRLYRVELKRPRRQGARR